MRKLLRIFLFSLCGISTVYRACCPPWGTCTRRSASSWSSSVSASSPSPGTELNTVLKNGKSLFSFSASYILLKRAQKQIGHFLRVFGGAWCPSPPWGMGRCHRTLQWERWVAEAGNAVVNLHWDLFIHPLTMGIFGPSEVHVLPLGGAGRT